MPIDAELRFEAGRLKRRRHQGDRDEPRLHALERQHRQAGLFGAPFHLRVNFGRHDLIERLAVGQHRLRERGHHQRGIGGLVDVHLFDQRLRIREGLVDGRAQRIPLRRQHVQRSEQVRDRSALALHLPEEILPGLSRSAAGREQQQADNRCTEAMTHDLRLARAAEGIEGGRIEG